MNRMGDPANHDVLIVGAGLVGLSAAIEARDAGADVMLLSQVHPLRSHSGAAVVLATGGAARVFGQSSNALINTGDGVALTWRAGLPAEDMEFFQTHPTGLLNGILVTEGARGEGAYLVNAKGERFMAHYATDCIACQCCFSDCPKRQQDASFLGPATCLAMFKRAHHPQEGDPTARLERAAAPGGVFDCDRHGNCVKVCPKDCRPMRAILMLQRDAGAAGR